MPSNGTHKFVAYLTYENNQIHSQYNGKIEYFSDNIINFSGRMQLKYNSSIDTHLNLNTEVARMNQRYLLKKEDLLDSWKLLAFKITSPNGLTKNWGPNSNGVLIYEKSGHMSTSINSGASLDDCAANIDKNILFYAGTYKLTGHNQITHYVTNASNPERVGKQFIRHAELIEGKYLRLTAEGDYGHADLLWEKM